MYTSGAKKVAVFPVGGAASPGGVGQSPKQPINQGSIFGNTSSQTGSGLNLSGGIPRTSSNSSLPQPPKLPVVPNPKTNAPGMVKVPLPGVSGVPKVGSTTPVAVTSSPTTFPSSQRPISSVPVGTCPLSVYYSLFHLIFLLR